MWKLTKEQRDAIEANLKDKGNYPVRVTCVPGDVQSRDFAEDLCRALKKAGWDPIGPHESEHNVPLTGVSLGVRDYSNPGMGAHYLRQALRAAGLIEKGATDFQRASDAIQIGLCIQVGRSL